MLNIFLYVYALVLFKQYCITALGTFKTIKHTHARTQIRIICIIRPTTPPVQSLDGLQYRICHFT